MTSYYLRMALVLIGIFILSISSVHAETVGEYVQSGNDSFYQGDFQQAIYDYSKAIDLNPNLAKAYNNRGVSYAQLGFMSPAIADFTMAIANKPDDAEAYNNRGHTYAQQIKLPQAIADFTMAIRINAIYVKAYNNRALAYYNLKEYDKAWADVNKVKKIGGVTDSDFIEALRKASDKTQ